MLTIIGTDLDSLVLGVPNNNVRKQDRKVALMTAGTTLHLLVLQIRGCELARLEEV